MHATLGDGLCDDVGETEADCERDDKGSFGNMLDGADAALVAEARWAARRGSAEASSTGAPQRSVAQCAALAARDAPTSL